MVFIIFNFIKLLSLLKSLWYQPVVHIPTVPDIIRSNGYVCEVHHVNSKDGYILEMHRIPYGRLYSNNSKSTIFMQHGLLTTSVDWIVAGPDKSLGFILADAGYDVWLGNVRGNRYSRKHVYLDPDKDAKYFWNFSWHQMGIYDIPAMIDYVIGNVKQEQIYYIGHSQGTTVFFVMCSEKPMYNSKIKAFFGLAPVAWTANIKSPIMQKLAKSDNLIEPILDIIGMHEFLPTNEFLSKFEMKVCADKSLFQPLCTNVFFMIYGLSKSQLNNSILLKAIQHVPAGASSKQLIHFAQGYNFGHFRKYDYGLVGNKKQYGSKEPPDYALENIIAPVYLFCSTSDWLSSEVDVIRLHKKLKNSKGLLIISEKEFNHADFILSGDAYELIYKYILQAIEQN